MLGPSPYPPPFATPTIGVPQIQQPVNNNPPPGMVPKEATLPRYVNYLADYSGCGHWRILWPEAVINARGDGMSQSTTAMVTDPRWYTGVKCVKVQRQASAPQKEFIKFLKQVQQEHGFKIIYEVDDVVFREVIPDYNKFKFAFDTEEVRQNCIDIINLVDEVTVTCDFMRRLYQEKTGQEKITVIPNFVPNFWMGQLFNPRTIERQFEANKRKPRILYTGSGAHYDVDNKVGGEDDMSGVRDFIRKTVDKYQWVFVGAFPPQLNDLVIQKKIEFYPWQQLLRYPYFISTLNAQLMVAPLQPNDFNRAKSDIKFIEACILGIPCLCQDIETYHSAPANLRFSTIDEFEDKIDKILNYKKKNKYFQNMHKLREIGQRRILELDQNIGSHLEALNTPFGSSEREFLKEWN
jgi:hypothetical protein|tara:strand:+ start:851 stop:2074 length:1224 start_codon:yes stop_codon:yes gene_type:complete